MKRLKIFQMRVADPSTKERLNELLAASSADYRATASYYEDRPQLGEYTVNTEIKRMTYTVVPPQGGEAISDVEGIRSIYAASAGTDPGACRGRGKDSMGTGGGRGRGQRMSTWCGEWQTSRCWRESRSRCTTPLGPRRTLSCALAYTTLRRPST